MCHVTWLASLVTWLVALCIMWWFWANSAAIIELTRRSARLSTLIHATSKFFKQGRMTFNSEHCCYCRQFAAIGMSRYFTHSVMVALALFFPLFAECLFSKFVECRDLKNWLGLQVTVKESILTVCHVMCHCCPVQFCVSIFRFSTRYQSLSLRYHFPISVTLYSDRWKIVWCEFLEIDSLTAKMRDKLGDGRLSISMEESQCTMRKCPIQR